ncbi:MAG: hypothetical protein EHM64_11695, partial [Ignavibacteriae bacterium]
MLRILSTLLILAALSLPALFAQQAPYNGAPASIPGSIQAAEYDLGGEGVAYHDMDPTNSG